jgi:uncharacterized protein involved in exopolysaccharide biosynthesis
MSAATATAVGWLNRLHQRRVRLLGYVLAALVLAVLCLFPRPYMARAKIVPGDSGANSLVSVIGALGGGQAQNLASLFGDRGATEVALQLSRSEAVTNDVVERLDLAGPGKRFADAREARLMLRRKVDVHTLLGGILEIETEAHDPDFALAVTNAYVSSISDRLSSYGRDQVARKRRIVEERMGTAQTKLAEAQVALDTFKRKYQLPDPQSQLGSQLSLRTNLEAQLQVKQVELATLRETAGPENPRLLAVQNQIASLREQLARTAANSISAAGPSVGELTGISLRYAKLYRDYLFAQAIYDVYSRSGEEVAVQEMVAQDRLQVAIVDPAHVDSERKFNTWAVALLALLAVTAAFFEIYAPLTGLWGSTARPYPDQIEELAANGR